MVQQILFLAAPAFTLGVESRLDPFMERPGIANWDFALFKTTQITERVGLQFHAEGFNLFCDPRPVRPAGNHLRHPIFGVIISQLEPL